MALPQLRHVLESNLRETLCRIQGWTRQDEFDPNSPNWGNVPELENLQKYALPLLVFAYMLMSGLFSPIRYLSFHVQEIIIRCVRS
eukprot:COSAG05_NODE_147_length_16383_cov_266.102555_20_plen_86_part_00